jgi:1,2-phenylacetyl-CoA epoxidase catalytic subunit
MAQSYHLRHGDRALMRGTLQQQTIALENEETTSINHFYVTSLEVLSHSKRTSITAYEKEKERKSEIWMAWQKGVQARSTISQFSDGSFAMPTEFCYGVFFKWFLVGECTF